MIAYTEDETEFLVNEISERIDNNKNSNYDIFNYILDGLSMTVSIDKLTSSKRYRMILKTYPYGCDDEYCDETILFHECKENIKEIVDFLFTFRNNYKYSKIIDTIVKNNEFVKKEKRFMLLNKLCKNEEIENCCVCLEPNLLKTTCNHNLCRVCYSNIKYLYDDEIGDEVKKCPMCREQI